MTRALGVDLGSRRIGLALTDPGGTAAFPFAVIDRSAHRQTDHQTIVAAAVDHDAEVVVVGLPLSLDGTVGPAARRVLSEVELLRQVAEREGEGPALRVVVHDERLSTVSAERSLREAQMSRTKRREHVDQVAAALILQSWIDAGGEGVDEVPS